MKFADIFTRADEDFLHQILGNQTIKILTTLDETKTYNKYLRQIVIDLYGAEGLFLNKKTRDMFIDLLREEEARFLGKVLGIKDWETAPDIYELLKSQNIKRGSRQEEMFFRFFNIVPPPLEEIIVESTSVCNTGYPLFKHQRSAIWKIKELLYNEPNRVLLHMPTGSGKTRTAMNIITDHMRQFEPTVVIWLASTEELCQQAVEEFHKAWGYLGNRDVEVHRIWGNHSVDIDKIYDGFIVAGLPKMFRLIKSKKGLDVINTLADKISLIIMDEAHQAVAHTYKTILDILFYVGGEKKLLGLSATPGRTWNDVDADAKLANFFSKKKVKLEIDGYENPIDYLVKEGYLAKVNYRNLLHNNKAISEQDLKEIYETMDIPLGVLKALGEDEQRNLKIIIEAERLTSTHQRIIIFTPTVESSNLVASILSARGHLAYSVTSETPTSKRRQIIEDFKDNGVEPKILCNYGVLTTGFDAPRTSAAIIGRPTLSLVLFSQMVGRAIRGVKSGGNSEAEIVTIVDKDLPGFRTVAESFNNWEDVWE